MYNMLGTTDLPLHQPPAIAVGSVIIISVPFHAVSNTAYNMNVADGGGDQDQTLSRAHRLSADLTAIRSTT
jgi:hypothetical protein